MVPPRPVVIFAPIDTLRGRVRPNRVSWVLWALAPLITITATRD